MKVYTAACTAAMPIPARSADCGSLTRGKVPAGPQLECSEGLTDRLLSPYDSRSWDPGTIVPVRQRQVARGTRGYTYECGRRSCRVFTSRKCLLTRTLELRCVELPPSRQATVMSIVVWIVRGHEETSSQLVSSEIRRTTLSHQYPASILPKVGGPHCQTFAMHVSGVRRRRAGDALLVPERLLQHSLASDVRICWDMHEPVMLESTNSAF